MISTILLAIVLTTPTRTPPTPVIEPPGCVAGVCITGGAFCTEGRQCPDPGACANTGAACRGPYDCGGGLCVWCHCLITPTPERRPVTATATATATPIPEPTSSGAGGCTMDSSTLVQVNSKPVRPLSAGVGIAWLLLPALGLVIVREVRR